MKELIQKMLELSGERYEAWVIDNFLLWCNLNSYDDRDCQKLLANSALFRWWHNEYTKLEEIFVDRAHEFHGKADKHILREYYTETVINIGCYYSKALVRQARRHKPVTPQYN